MLYAAHGRHKAGKRPPAGPLGEIWYGITVSAVRMFFMPFPIFILFCCIAKNEDAPQPVTANRTSPILCFCLCIIRIFHPPYPPIVCHYNTAFGKHQGKCYKFVTSGVKLLHNIIARKTTIFLQM